MRCYLHSQFFSVANEFVLGQIKTAKKFLDCQGDYLLAIKGNKNF